MSVRITPEWVCDMTGIRSFNVFAKIFSKSNKYLTFAVFYFLILLSDKLMQDRLD